MSIKSSRLWSTFIKRNISKCSKSNHNFLYASRDNFQLGSRTFFNSVRDSARVAFKLSDIGEGIREVALKEWFVKEGDTVKQFDNICEVQSDKASVTITSRYDGVVKKLYHKIDDIALVGLPLVDIETDEAEDGLTENEIIAEDDSVSKESIIKKDIHDNVPKNESESENEIVIVTNEPNQTSDVSDVKKLCIPSVRRLAKEHNVDLSKILGTGKSSRILKEDVLKYLNSPPTAPSVNQSASILTPSDRVEPIKGFKKAMVKTMTDALKIPTFVYSDEISVTNLTKIRNDVKEEFLKQGIKISLMPFFIKAASNALSKFPILNSSVDEKCENIQYKSAHNIGVAMDTKAGLAVPVIRNVQSLSLLEIAKELNRLMEAGKLGNFSTNDLIEGTFSISNIGVIGGTYTKPVILPPQVAIIAMGQTKILPRFDEEMKIVPEKIINLSGAADHRIVDGATMAHFVNAIKKQIENPNLLLLNL